MIHLGLSPHERTLPRSATPSLMIRVLGRSAGFKRWQIVEHTFIFKGLRSFFVPSYSNIRFLNEKAVDIPSFSY